MSRYKYCVIVGVSRGLGAAMAEELLEKGGIQIIGISRTGIEKITGSQKWTASGRYKHVVADIASFEGKRVIKENITDFGNESVCVIFNSAVVEADVNSDKTVETAISAKINSVGVDGLINCIEAFQEHLLKRGGLFVGISSFSALTPPVAEPRVAYPASKAYLDMTLRCLRNLWRGRCGVVTVHLGHLGNKAGSGLTGLLAVNYKTAAKKIITAIFLNMAPDEINYPFLYCLAYRRILSFVPDKAYFTISRLLSKRSVK
ncbi:SDR family NAD(P)-dependent oxidoreductase [bacterium]|nr:MAG: SDR family NAD(P)-dependent oxidoreductase [bacterium]